MKSTKRRERKFVKMKFVNCTSKRLNTQWGVFEPSENPIGVNIDEIAKCMYKTKSGYVYMMQEIFTNIPEEKEGVLYIVPAFVKYDRGDRKDFVFAYENNVSEHGHSISEVGDRVTLVPFYPDEIKPHTGETKRYTASKPDKDGKIVLTPSK